MKRSHLALWISTLVLGPTLASAQHNFSDRARVIARLADAYGETRQSIGVGAQGRVIETFASIETGTWTITITMPDGQACLVASGQSFENLNESSVSKGNDT